MTRRYRVAVVGGGVIGAAVFHRLSQAYGDAVLLVERARRHAPAGASAVSGGIVRVFHLDEQLCEDALAGLRFFQQLASLHGQAFSLRRTGFLTLVGSAQLEAARSRVAQLGKLIELKWLSGAEAAAMLGAPPDPAVAAAVYEPHAGYVDVPALTALLLELGCSHGGVVRHGLAVDGIASAGGAVCGIETGEGRIDCDSVVLCTGAWTPALAQRLGVALGQPLRTKAIQINRVAPTLSRSALPAFVDLTSDVYGRPDGELVLLGCPVDCWDVDPDLVEAPEPAQYRDVVRRGRQRFPWLDEARVVSGSRRPDAYSASGRGEVAWSPSLRGLLVASGYSGGGVKLAPVAAAQALARLGAQPWTAEARHG